MPTNFYVFFCFCVRPRPGRPIKRKPLFLIVFEATAGSTTPKEEVVDNRVLGPQKEEVKEEKGEAEQQKGEEEKERERKRKKRKRKRKRRRTRKRKRKRQGKRKRERKRTRKRKILTYRQGKKQTPRQI